MTLGSRRHGRSELRRVLGRFGETRRIRAGRSVQRRAESDQSLNV